MFLGDGPTNRKRILIIYKYLPQWRVDFFNRLRQSLARQNVELALVYGKLGNQRADEVDLPWGKYVPNKVFPVGRTQLLWQPCLGEVKKSDLIIVEQANKLLLNYVLMALRRTGKKKLAFWGHGLNRQAHRNSLANRFKVLFLRQADWWFAYTEGVAKFLTTAGFPRERVTVVYNAIDTLGLVEAYRCIPEEELSQLRQRLHLGGGGVGIFCGGLYAEKRIDFLISAADAIRRRLDNFQLLVLGAGPEQSKVVEACSQRPWMKYVGPVFALERAPYFKLSSVLLTPGAVGLVILDSFAFETPLITTNSSSHGPEIEYLENGVNGLMVDNDPEVYAESAAKLLRDSGRLNGLKQGCAASAKMYTLESMVDNFAGGVFKSLQSS